MMAIRKFIFVWRRKEEIFELLHDLGSFHDVDQVFGFADRARKIIGMSLLYVIK